ncbi:MAG: alpha/beta hydrolase [Bacteroidetes bacterium]|nr:MAG: alpha/beta hydrolase [Bacteroidota bacterium]
MSDRLIPFCIALFLVSCGPKPTDTEPVRILSQGTEIHYSSCGTGDTTLLFVHGWCIDGTYWTAQRDEFCQTYRVVTMDLPGFGQSEKNRAAWTIEAYGEDVRTLIRQLQLKNVVLVGHSMGGDVVLEAAQNNPDVIALVGVDNFKEVGLIPDSQARAGIDGFFQALRQSYHVTAPGFAANSLFHPSTDSLVKNRVLGDITRADSAIAIASLESLFAYMPEETQQLGKLTQKLYLINSDATPTHVPGLEASGADFEVLGIPATGHYPMNEKPALFNALLRQVMGKISR